MAFGTLDDDDDAVMSEINMTPLVDVMLVLLIIFIITIPVINHAVKIDLPRASNQPNDTKPQNINVSIDADGKVYWNQAEVDETTLQTNIAEAAKHEPQPELHLRADREVRYERVAEVMAAAQQGGLGKIGFITEPKQQ
jgi:biopolymer transport protein ExbD